MSQESRLRFSYLFNSLGISIVVNALLLLAVLASAKGLTRVLFGNQAYCAILWATMVSVLSYSCFVILYGFYRGTGCMWKANIWQLCLVAVIPLVIALVYAGSGKLYFIVMVTALCFFAVLLPLATYWIRGARDGFVVGRAQLMELMRYGAPRIPGALAYTGILGVGVFLSPYFVSLTSAGFLAIGTSILKMVEGAVDSFGRVILPKAAQFSASGQHDFLREKIIDIAGFVVHMGLFMSCQLFLWADVIILVWLGPRYAEVIVVMRIFSLAIIPFVMYSMLRSIIDAIEVRAINARNLYLSFAITVSACVILAVMKQGTVGLALGTAGGIFVLGISSIVYLYRRFAIHSLELMLGRCLFLNGILTVAGFGTKKILESKLAGLRLIGAACVVSTILLIAYCLALYALRARWLFEVKKRINFGKELSPV
jgi:O-antigen/teichoic acid export membrane protein